MVGWVFLLGTEVERVMLLLLLKDKEGMEGGARAKGDGGVGGGEKTFRKGNWGLQLLLLLLLLLLLEEEEDDDDDEDGEKKGDEERELFAAARRRSTSRTVLSVEPTSANDDDRPALPSLSSPSPVDVPPPAAALATPMLGRAPSLTTAREVIQ